MVHSINIWNQKNVEDLEGASKRRDRLKNEIGSKSSISMILNEKRSLTKGHIAKLTEHFSLKAV